MDFRGKKIAVQKPYAKKLINDPRDIETEFIDGLVKTYPGLQYLDGFPEVKVVLRADVCPGPYDKVAVISGGGSGHEPAHAGYVGEGMLTAAICGRLFACPTVEAILAGIRAVTGPMGCLLIVMKHAGDPLNFGLAAEQAKCEGYKVETVIVEDDCYLHPTKRGSAGTILVHKVAGAAAAAGLSLADVAAEARYASENVRTMGVALNGFTRPGMVLQDRLGPAKMELGVGIDGDGIGVQVDALTADRVVLHVMRKILSEESNPIVKGDKVVLMVNGLGGTPLMELMIATGRANPQLPEDLGLHVDRVYTGSFLTSLDMEGFSISLMKSQKPFILERLDAETKAPYWPVGVKVEGERVPVKSAVPIPPSPSAKAVEPRRRPLKLTEQGQLLEAAIVSAANAILDPDNKLNQWDEKVADGDCGSNMYKGAKAILEDIRNYPLNDNAAQTVGEIGLSLGKAMGETSGIIYSIFFMAACAQLKTSSSSKITSKQWSEALAAGIASVSKYGGAKAGYRTMLDALIPASSLLEELLNSGHDPFDAFVLSSEAALDGANRTKTMPEQHHLSPYTRTVIGEVFSSVPDPGAMAAATWYRAAAIAVKEKNDFIVQEKRRRFFPFLPFFYRR